MDEHCLVLITCGNETEAHSIARGLVDRRLAAGVQSLPITSVYRWEGQIVDDTEVLLLAKTRRNLFDRVRAVVEEIHSYQVPPVVMVELAGANADYLEWIDDNVDP